MQGGEGPVLERGKKPAAGPGMKPFEVGEESTLNHVNVDHAASQVTPEKGISLNERYVERVGSAEAQCTHYVALRVLVQNTIIDVPTKASGIHFPGSAANRAALWLHTFL